MQVDQRIFRFPFSETTTDQVRNRIYLVMVHDGSADSNRSGSFSNFYFLERAIALLLEHGFTAVIGHVDKCRLELHEGVQMVIYRTYRLPLQRRKNFEGNSSVFCLV